jgi:hypothetical protein
MDPFTAVPRANGISPEVAGHSTLHFRSDARDSEFLDMPFSGRLAPNAQMNTRLAKPEEYGPIQLAV